MLKKVLFVMFIILVIVPVAYADDGDTPNLLEAISPHLQTLLEAILVAVVPWLAYHIKQYFDEATRQAQQVLTAEQYALVEIVVRNLVHAAEQIYERTEGEQKKLYVLKHAQDVLAGYGLNLDLIDLEAMIESMVRQALKGGEEKVNILPV